MVKGIGIDIIEINRIKNSIKKNKKFLNRIFTKNEIKFFDKKNNNINTITGNFAAKEAFSKALGTGIKFSWKNIEILRDESGKPYINLYGKAKDIFENKKFKNCHISISHNKTQAVANCIIE
ncbi:MAG: holo-ACP synthase [Bacillota bacterium]